VSADALQGPEPLTAEHRLGDFRCGVSSLDHYLQRQALRDQQAEKSRSYVICRDGRVVGYYSLAAAGVEPQAATDRLSAGQGRQTIPVILIGRLAVDVREQGRRRGEMLLVDALSRCASAADAIGARAVLVHALDERARGFYEKYGFEPSPTDHLHMIVLMKDVRRSLE